MLIQLLTQHPEAIVQIVAKTPVWVGGIFAALVALGVSQMRDGTASLVRVSVMPVAMAGFGIWGLFSAFSQSPLFAEVLLAWAATAAVMVALIAPMKSPARYDAATRTFHVPGSVVPMLLILGIFLTKYAAGVELAMQPQLAHDGQFTLALGAIYGAFNGLFTGRAARNWRLAYKASTVQAAPAAA